MFPHILLLSLCTWNFASLSRFSFKSKLRPLWSIRKNGGATSKTGSFKHISRSANIGVRNFPHFCKVFLAEEQISYPTFPFTEEPRVEKDCRIQRRLPKIDDWTHTTHSTVWKSWKSCFFFIMISMVLLTFPGIKNELLVSNFLSQWVRKIRVNFFIFPRPTSTSLKDPLVLPLSAKKDLQWCPPTNYFSTF